MFFHSLKTDKRGVTLVEILVALGIFVFLAGAVVALFLSSRKYNNIVWEQLETQNQGRKVAQDFLTNELRVVSASSIGAYPIEVVSSTEIIFYTNLDKDTLVERVRYFFSGRILKKGVIKPTGNPLVYNSGNEVLTDVAYDVVTSTSRFSYYGSDYTGTEPALVSPVNVVSIRMVGISLTLEEGPQCFASTV